MRTVRRRSEASAPAGLRVPTIRTTRRARSSEAPKKEERSGGARVRAGSGRLRRGAARRDDGYAGRRDGARPRRGSNAAEWGPLIGSGRAATGFDDHRRRRYGRHRGRGRADPPGDSRSW